MNENRRWFLLRVALVGTAALICLLAALVLMSPKNKVSSDRTIAENFETSEADVDENRTRRIRNLRDARQDLLRRMHQAEIQEAESSPESAEEPNVLNLSPREIAKRYIRAAAIRENHVEELSKTLDEMVEEQRFNEVWTKDVQTLLSERLHTVEDKNGSVESVSCHETLCKIVSRHSTFDGVSDFFQIETDEEGTPIGAGHRIKIKQPDGTIESTYYMTRYGNGFAFDESIYNRMYERATGKRFEDIEPSEEAIEHFTQKMTASNSEGAEVIDG